MRGMALLISLLALLLPLAAWAEGGAPVQEIDHYVIELDTAAYITEEEIACYRRVVDGVFAREARVELTDSYDSNLNVLGALRNNPYHFLLSGTEFTPDHRALLLEYAYSPEEQREIVEYMDGEFLAIFQEILEEGMSDLEKALAVYNCFGRRISFDYGYVEGLELSEEKFLYPEIEIYQGLKTGKGVCHTYVYLCEFALRQLEVDCLRLSADMEDSDEAHMWLALRLEGEWYHCDPTWDSEPGFVGLRYFGMTDAERLAGGVQPSWNVDVDVAFGPISAQDGRFECLRDVYDYQMLGGHRIRVWREGSQDGEVLEIDGAGIR